MLLSDRTLRAARRRACAEHFPRRGSDHDRTSLQLADRRAGRSSDCVRTPKPPQRKLRQWPIWSGPYDSRPPTLA